MALALVTGATSGIGRSIALALKGRGYDVVAIGRQRRALDELATLGIRAVQADLSDRAALGQALTGLEPDVLINNAGIMPPLTNFCDLAEADMEAALSVNIGAVLAVTRVVAPGMRQRRKGHIFFTGSTAGHGPFPNMAVYCATKAAVGGFAQALRLDLAPAGVRVTEIVAGRVETGLYRDTLTQEARDAMYANNAAAQGEDVAAMVLAALDLPPHANVGRFDILPTFPPPPVGTPAKERSS